MITESSTKSTTPHFVIYLGIRTLLRREAPQHTERAEPKTLPRMFFQGMTVELLNPKTALFFLAFLPQFVDPARGAVTWQFLLLEEQTEPHEAHFRIHDQGMGIPRDQHAHIFERFVRGENVRVAGIRGTGLGLYLCRELIERHGGQINFESKEGVGSTFFFSLPAT